MEPIRYNWQGAVHPSTGLDSKLPGSLCDRLVDARREALDDLQRYHDGQASTGARVPLDAAFMDMPERILADYRRDREGSELGRILSIAKRLSDEMDRVVVLGIGGSYMGARALMDGCCHPYHNELERSNRGGPRVYFEGNNVDNDASAGLLDLLATSDGQSVGDAWGIVVISKSGGTLETAIAFRQFTEALRRSVGGDAQRLARRIVPVTGSSGRLNDLASALGCADQFLVPDGVGGRFSILSPVGLLPAAILGLDVVRLLEGAVAMNERFREAAVEDNPVLEFVGVCHQLEQTRGATIRVLSAWAKGLEAVGLWYDQLLAESLAKSTEHGATPVTTVNTRDLHSRGQQHQEGRTDKLITNLVVQRWRRDPMAVGTSEFDQDKLNAFAGKTLPDVMAAAIEGTHQAYADAGRPTATLSLPACDEPSLGQLFQMLMLATVVEGILIGVNPYGQPGVEAYKNNMTRILRGE